MRLAWLASAAVHAGLAAWLAIAVMRDAPVRARVTPPAAPQVAAGTAMPIDLVMLADSSATSHGGGRGRSRALAIAATASSAITEPASTPIATHEPVAPGSLFRMRGIDLRAPADVVDSRPAPAVVPDQPSGRIEWLQHGHGVIHDRVTTVLVDPDGTAQFKDRSDFSIDLPLPSLDALRHLPSELKSSPGALHDALRAWYSDLQVEQEFLAHYDRRQHLDEIPNGCDAYAELNCIDPDRPAPPHDPTSALMSGEADVSAWLERKFVGDPYASRKKKLLDDTFVERAAHGAAFRADQLVHGAERMHDNLERLWATTRDTSARRAALFELWDECAEGEGPLGEAGQRARDVVVLWIRAKLPAHGVDAYTSDELAAFADRRHSAQPFDPYR